MLSANKCVNNKLTKHALCIIVAFGSLPAMGARYDAGPGATPIIHQTTGLSEAACTFNQATEENEAHNMATEPLSLRIGGCSFLSGNILSNIRVKLNSANGYLISITPLPTQNQADALGVARYEATLNINLDVPVDVKSNVIPPSVTRLEVSYE